MSERFDVIIVGGGIFGCSVAWSLARRGVGRVLVLERAEVGSQSTSRAASVLTCVAGHPAKSAIFQETWDVMPVIEEELGESLGVHEVGSLHVARSEVNKSSLGAQVALAAEVGEVVEEWSPERARERVRWLDVGEGDRSLFLPRAGYVDSYLFATAYARAARARGVELRTGVEVHELCFEEGRVTGVMSSAGELRADWVVNCAGPWAGVLSAQVGCHLPMAPVRSQYWITEEREEFDPEQPVIFLPDVPAYTRGEVGGLLFGLRGGASPARDPRALPADLGALEFSEDPEGWETLSAAGEGFSSFCPLLETVGLAHYVSGPSTYTPDGDFILGACEGVDGYLVATGCCGSGIAASGGVGRALSELILDGESGLDLARFSPDRFGDIDAFSQEWLDRCAATRAAKSVC